MRGGSGGWRRRRVFKLRGHFPEKGVGLCVRLVADFGYRGLGVFLQGEEGRFVRISLLCCLFFGNPGRGGGVLCDVERFWSWGGHRVSRNREPSASEKSGENIKCSKSLYCVPMILEGRLSFAIVVRSGG